MKRLTHDDFIRKSTTKHGNKYNYDKVVYTNTKVLIICPVHGDFYQTPKMHFSTGCEACGAESKRDTTETFITKSKAIYGDRFIYDKVNYITSRLPVLLHCTHCNTEFEAIPKHHMIKPGCSTCAHNGYSRKIDGYLYIHLVQDGTETIGYKMGITNREPIVRFKEINKRSTFKHTIVFYFKSTGTVIYDLEKLIHKECTMVDGLQHKLTDGFTEVISKEDFNTAWDIIQEVIHGHS